jgi:hypothetical protein
MAFSSEKCGKLLQPKIYRIAVQYGHFLSEKQSQGQRTLVYHSGKTSILGCPH